MKYVSIFCSTVLYFLHTKAFPIIVESAPQGLLNVKADNSRSLFVSASPALVEVQPSFKEL